MDHPIVIKYKFTAEDLLEAYRYHDRHICRPPFRIALNCTMALLMVAGALGCWVALYISGGTATWLPVYVGLILMIVGLYWFAVLPFHRRWIVQRQHAKRPDRGIDVEWEFRSANISVRSRLSKSEMNWEVFLKIVQAPSGILLYWNEQLFSWLPRHAFETNEEFERFTELAKNKVQRFFDVG